MFPINYGHLGGGAGRPKVTGGFVFTAEKAEETDEIIVFYRIISIVKIEEAD